MKYPTRGSRTIAALSAALLLVPSLKSALAAGTDTPAPPPLASDAKQASPNGSKGNLKADGKSKKPSDKRSDVGDPQFLNDYRVAYTMIYKKSDYAAAIPLLEALGRNDLADVANLIGYSYRKLGNAQLASLWYERALKADANHVRTWQYYGLWQIEQGNREQAKYHLGKIEGLCGKGCPEYRSLAAALSMGQVSY